MEVDKPTNEELLAMYRQLHYLPPKPPCDICPNKIYEDRIQACDNCGCGIVQLYFAVKYYHDNVRLSR